MRIAIVTRKNSPHSIRVYRDNVVAVLSGGDADFIEVGPDQTPPADADLLWDPTLAGALPPGKGALGSEIPVVATVHGAAPFVLPLSWIWSGAIDEAKRAVFKMIARRRWKRFAKRVDAVITVSNYGTQEVTQAFPLDAGKISVVYHGLNHAVFYPPRGEAQGSTGREKMFLHVSAYKGKKNLPRVIAAYKQYFSSCADDNPAKMLIVSPGCPLRSDIDSLEIVTQSMGPEQLAELYRRAMCFVMPSLRETFGLPILEAMGCGAAVISSTCGACGEVTGDAAILVDPFSVEQIADAMRRVAGDDKLAMELSARSVARAGEFSWEKSARQHMEVFCKAAGLVDNRKE